jgi:hypothetical protein
MFRAIFSLIIRSILTLVTASGFIHVCRCRLLSWLSRNWLVTFILSWSIWEVGKPGALQTKQFYFGFRKYWKSFALQKYSRKSIENQKYTLLLFRKPRNFTAVSRKIETFFDKNNSVPVSFALLTFSCQFKGRSSKDVLNVAIPVVFHCLNNYKIPFKTQHIKSIMLYSNMFRLIRVIIRLSLGVWCYCSNTPVCQLRSQMCTVTLKYNLSMV